MPFCTVSNDELKALALAHPTPSARCWRRSEKRGSDPEPEQTERLLAVRRRIETTLGQLVERLGCPRVRAKNLWNLEHRLVRKMTDHTAAAWLNVLAGRQTLQIDQLVA